MKVSRRSLQLLFGLALLLGVAVVLVIANYQQSTHSGKERISLTTQSANNATEDASVDEVDFARQILPILSDKCFTCHGPDTKNEKLVRLDLYEAATKDLKQRGMLDDTLVVWGGEFGRTAYCQGKLTKENYGRDHHPRCFTVWMAGGGVKPGITYGQTDDFGYNFAHPDGTPMKPQPNIDKWTPGTMHIHDLNATILHLLGIDHTKLTYRFQGRDFRLTDVHGHVIKELLL